MAKLSKPPSYDGAGNDSDPKGRRNIKPASPRSRNGKDDDKKDVSGVYPKERIDRAYETAKVKTDGNTDF
jgi:hypothetical protein